MTIVQINFYQYDSFSHSKEWYFEDRKNALMLEKVLMKKYPDQNGDTLVFIRDITPMDEHLDTIIESL